MHWNIDGRYLPIEELTDQQLLDILKSYSTADEFGLRLRLYYRFYLDLYMPVADAFVWHMFRDKSILYLLVKYVDGYKNILEQAQARGLDIPEKFKNKV